MSKLNRNFSNFLATHPCVEKRSNQRYIHSIFRTFFYIFFSSKGKFSLQTIEMWISIFLSRYMIQAKYSCVFVCMLTLNGTLGYNLQICITLSFFFHSCLPAVLSGVKKERKKKRHSTNN